MQEVNNKCLISIEDSLGVQCLEHYGLPKHIRRGEVIQNTDYLREINYDTHLIIQEVTNNKSSLTKKKNKVMLFYKLVS